MTEFTIITHIHNEAAWLPYFIWHYQALADRIWILDDGSTDGTAEVARQLLPECRIDRRESTEWDAKQIDIICRNMEREVTAGWVMSLACDEFVMCSRQRLLEIFDQAESEGYEFIRCIAFDMLQRPDDPFDSEKPLGDQFSWGVRNTQYDRLLHRNQHSKDWVYQHGRHLLPEFLREDRLAPYRPTLFNYTMAPLELAHRRREICASRVGPHDGSIGLGIEKIGYNRERYDAECKSSLENGEHVDTPDW
jgi:hypothetical protein